MAIITTFNCRFPYSQKGKKEKASWIYHFKWVRTC